MTKLPITLVVIAGSALFSGMANASTIVQTFSFGPTVTDWNKTFTLDKFNPALGTLQSVAFSETVSITTSGTVSNTSSKVENMTLWLFVDGLLDLLPGTSVSQLDAQPITPTVIANGVAPGAFITFGPYIPAATDGATLTSPADLALYKGVGTFDLDSSTIGTTVLIVSGGNTAANITTTATLDGTLTYTYVPSVIPPVPEPATMVLIGGSLLGLGLLQKRLRRA